MPGMPPAGEAEERATGRPGYVSASGPTNSRRAAMYWL